MISPIDAVKGSVSFYGLPELVPVLYTSVNYNRQETCIAYLSNYTTAALP